MMQAMPYKIQGKGVVELSSLSLSSQISSSDWNKCCLDNNFHHKDSNFEDPRSTTTTTCSSFETESDPKTSPSPSPNPNPNPSPPTSSSTLCSNTAGVADPTCPDNNNNNNPCGGGELGLEEWESIFPSGDGSLLPWIMGETGDDMGMGMGLKHLLQSGGSVDYESNAGLGIVEQGSAAASLDGLNGDDNAGLISSSGVHLGLIPPEFDGNAKVAASLLSNSSSGVVDCKVSGSNASVLIPSCNPMANVLGSISTSLQTVGCGGGLGFPASHSFDFGDEKPQIYNPQLVMNQHQAQGVVNPSFLMSPLGYCHQLEQHMYQPQPQAKRHNPGVVLDPGLGQVVKNPFMEPGHEFLLRKQQQLHPSLQQFPLGLANQLVPPHLQQKPVMVPKQNQLFPLPFHQQQQLQEQAIKDQLFKAADLIQTGNFSLAQEILARLNHHLSLPAKPLIRAALYVKEALQLLLLMSNPVAAPPPKTLTPYDVVHKMNAYKVFSDVSPITQFVNFTCTQAILEALDDADSIHIIDFDIGCGAQWASFIQELPLRKKGAPSLKITALAPLSTSHPFELGLIRENLMQFAGDNGVAFELHVLNLDLFDPSQSSMPNLRVTEDESVAVSLPIWACSNRPPVLPSILRFIKQCSPKIVVSLDRGFDRYDVPFPQHLIHTLESCTNFLESLDGLNVASDIANKIEKYFIQPRIENTLLGRVHAPDKMPHWKNLFASSGFMPFQFSNFTETQADYVVKRTPGRGFHVEKRQGSLVLNWQRRELVATSAWKC